MKSEERGTDTEPYGKEKHKEVSSVSNSNGCQTSSKQNQNGTPMQDAEGQAEENVAVRRPTLYTRIRRMIRVCFAMYKLSYIFLFVFDLSAIFHAANRW